jgi:hypothetical protein
MLGTVDLGAISTPEMLVARLAIGSDKAACTTGVTLEA